MRSTGLAALEGAGGRTLRFEGLVGPCSGVHSGRQLLGANGFNFLLQFGHFFPKLDIGLATVAQQYLHGLLLLLPKGYLLIQKLDGPLLTLLSHTHNTSCATLLLSVWFCCCSEAISSSACCSCSSVGERGFFCRESLRYLMEAMGLACMRGR